MTDKDLELMDENEELDELEVDYIEEENYDDYYEEEDLEEEIKEIVNNIDFLNIELPKSLHHLVNGYIDYAKEVVMDRAIPGIDGLKPSQRRILYAMKYIKKVRDLTKSMAVAGAVMEIHPHGEVSIYDTMVRMTDSSYHLNVPYLKGKGSFGKVFSSTSRPSAPRYTDVMLEKVADEFFQGMSGIEMINSYNDEYKEPVLLPVSFPSILCNPSQGIAVGIASNIPAFNFHEVNKATIELIEKGKISKPLCPDFTTGGNFIYNEKELHKLMTTGSARLKYRGNWHIEGKTIVLDEIPYYTTIEDIMKAVKDLPGVADVRNGTDKKGLRVSIECDTKKVVDAVLSEVLRVSTLQMSVNTNIVIIVDNKPREIGLIEILEEWVKFRSEVVEKQIRASLEEYDREIERLNILVDLMTTDSKREPFMDKLLNQGRAVTKEFLKELYPTANEEVFDYILNKSIGSLAGIGNKEKNELVEVKAKRVEVEETLNRIDSLIVEELKELNKRYKYPRRTKVTEEDYVFDKNVGKAKPEAVPVVVVVDGMFIKKLKSTPTNQKEEGAIKCMSDSIISLMDKKGNLLRVQVEHLDFSTAREKGIYIPNYIGTDLNEDIIDVEVIKNKKKGFLFEDGYVSVVDFNEWAKAKRVTKLTENAVGVGYMDTLIGPFRMDREYLILRTEKGKLRIVTTDFIIKGRKARTKVAKPGKGDKIVDMCSAHEEDLAKIIGDKERFMGGYRVIRKEDAFSEEEYEKVKIKNNSFND